ncbi:cation transport protein-domain-containing protein [Phascolomyces articulosus]|uniref:Cation transport protein-domain-containing protein n=1 Tax=Phascolomyces articulosus TaxID=60185 RepID=A0AAD5KD89_9FUNG|nr:cation transport protein-domain-containing protein [Phascolomyces articulosus]
MLPNFLINIKYSCIDIWHQKINFLVLHYVYIGMVCFIISGLFYIEPGTRWNFVDGLFMSATAITNTGTNTIDMSDLSVYQLLLQFFGSILGSRVLISLVIVLVRKHYFSKRFQDVLLFNRAQRLRERRNKRQFNKNLADVRTIIQQRLSSVHNNNIGRSNTMPAAYHQSQSSRIQHLPSSTTLKQSFPFHHLLKRGRRSSEDEDEADKKELQAIHDELRILDEEKDPEISIGGLYQQTTKTRPILLTHQSYSVPRVTDNTLTANNPQQQQPTTNVEPPQPNIAFAVNINNQRQEARQEFLEGDRSQKDLPIKTAENRQDPSWQQDDLSQVNELDQSSTFQENNPTYTSELTRQQRYSIGGAEYRALSFLSILIPIVYFSTAILSSIAMRIYIAVDDFAQEALRTTNPSGPIDPWLFSFFTCFSAYNNFGLAPTNTSLSAFVNAPFPLILVSILITIGNTGYPALLRFYIWCLYKLLPQSRAMDRETLRYLLDHPRRCYTLLFSASQTWWLVCVVVGLCVIEWVVFLATNFWLPVLDGISWPSRVMLGFFQGISTRNAGFTAVNILILNPGTQIVYIIAMYIAAYPVGITIRNSNVYQERELGIYSDGRQQEESTPEVTKLSRFPTISSVMTTSKKLIPKRPSFYVMTQVQRMLTREIMWVIAGIFCICVIEAEAIMGPSPITVLTVIYETVSAFGTAGSSTGYPGVTTAQAGSYHLLSKLILILLMYRGCHRGLPSTIDHAVQLPSEQLDKREEQEQKLRQRHAELMSQESLDLPNPRWRSRTCSLG